VIPEESRGADPQQPSAAPRLPPDDVVLNPVRLAVFCTVVEQHSFARAAEVLGLTPPAVSLHVRALETRWGTPLFDRQRRGGRLTEAGQVVYDYAVGVVRGAAGVRARLADLAGGQAGQSSWAPRTFTGRTCCQRCWPSSTVNTPAPSWSCRSGHRRRSGRRYCAVGSSSPSSTSRGRCRPASWPNRSGPTAWPSSRIRRTARAARRHCP